LRKEKVVKASSTGGDAMNLSKVDITSALYIFEASLDVDDGISKLAADSSNGPENIVVREEVKEITAKPNKAVATSYRGNPYYNEELRKVLDDSIDVEKDKNEAKPTGHSKGAADGKDKPKTSDGKENEPAESLEHKSAVTKGKSTVDKKASYVSEPSSVMKLASYTQTPSSGPESTKSSTQSEVKSSGTVVSETKQATPETKSTTEVPDSKAIKEDKTSGEPTEKIPKSAEVAKEKASQLYKKKSIRELLII
jgi:hypothetical protein